MDVEEILDECRKLRNLPPELNHRVFKEFEEFLSDIVVFLIFNRESNNPFFRAFQKRLKGKDLDPKKFETYLNLFLEYWEVFDSEALP